MGLVNPARLLAPLALVAALVGVIVVVQASRPTASDSESALPASTTAAPARGRQVRRPARTRAYVIRAGDTLTVIAERTGVPVEQIERLNPDLDAQALRVGQRLRLAP